MKVQPWFEHWFTLKIALLIHTQNQWRWWWWWSATAEVLSNTIEISMNYYFWHSCFHTVEINKWRSKWRGRSMGWFWWMVELRQMFIFTKVILEIAYGIFVSKQWASWIIWVLWCAISNVYIWLTEDGQNKVLLAIARSRFLINKVKNSITVVLKSTWLWYEMCQWWVLLFVITSKTSITNKQLMCLAQWFDAHTLTICMCTFPLYWLSVTTYRKNFPFT